MSVSRRDNRPVIEVVGASKSFILRRERSSALRESLSLARLTRRSLPSRSQGTEPLLASEEFWAVKDVSFMVYPGQSVGIVGHNGSGKSTMLKMLTGILKPTRGSVAVHGRVGALIEVGAGFHPDLTGRENIYLNGSILGLSRREIDGKFDEIVNFASLEKFIDTPVKRYSSGMYMRLGMAIAFSTKPDVLLIDEVLAVGDAQFQRKCIKQLDEFVAQGGAAVFVSHAMGQMADVCETCVWLDHGEARYIGATEKAIEQYMAVVDEREDADFKRNHPEEWEAREEEKRQAEEVRLAEEAEARRLEEEAARRAAEQEARTEAERARAEHAEAERARRLEEEKVEEERRRHEAWLADYDRPRLLGTTILDAQGHPRTDLRAGEPIEVRVAYQFVQPPDQATIGLEFYREDGLYCFGTSNYDHGLSFENLPLRGEFVMKVAFLSLNAGAYHIRLRLWADRHRPDWAQRSDDTVDNAAQFTVDAGAFAHGCVYVPVRWFPSVAASGTSAAHSFSAMAIAAESLKESSLNGH